MGTKTRGVFHRSVSVGLDVAYKAVVGDDAGFLESVHTFSDLDADIVTRVSDGEEGVFNDHLVWDVFEMDPRVLEFGHWVVEVVVGDFCCQVSGPFAGVGYGVVEVYLEVQLADLRGSGVAVVSDFFATDRQVNAMRFSLG